MRLFGFGKKKDKTKNISNECTCGCNSENNVTKENKCGCSCGEQVETESSVKILGGGCAKCNQLEAATVEALEKLGMDTTIEHVKDFAVIATYGVMTTPALVVDGKVLSYGKVLKTDEVIKLLEKERG